MKSNHSRNISNDSSGEKQRYNEQSQNSFEGSSSKPQQMQVNVFGENKNDEQSSLDDAMYKKIYNKLLAEKNKRNPSVKKNWGADEIKLLEYAVNTYLKKKKHSADKLTTHDWKEIANFIPGRTESQCLYKWNLTQHKVSFRKSTWHGNEDKILKELVKRHGKKHWQKIANELNERMGPDSKRAGKQCRERWLNHLDDRIIKGPWSFSEDLILLTKQKIIGNKWSDIVQYLPGRTENMVKNRFNTIAKQKREEKRNNSRKKLDDIIGGLEEEKQVEEKDSWIDEKIKELQEAIERKEDDPADNTNLSKISEETKEKKSKMNKRKAKNLQNPSQNGVAATEKPSSQYSNVVFDKYDKNNEQRRIIESTPQQYYLSKRQDSEFSLRGCQSPIDGFPQRRLPQSSNIGSMFETPKNASPNLRKLNDICATMNQEERYINISPLNPPRIIEQRSPIPRDTPKTQQFQRSITDLLSLPTDSSGELQRLHKLKSILEEFTK
mmetsp:Transcript_25963/g.25772  ORF Transcript_25963/g.25772 Transcript_25963/m.25772 type:complete len:495 (+) Transcript_25963:21-1505(+)